MNLPTISIVIPAYNAEKTILATLESIKKQSFQDFEAIIINDGSTDNTLELTNDFCSLDNRFKVINQKNFGVSTARNNGIDIAKGKWICFIDSDDLIEPSYLFHLYENSFNGQIVISNKIIEFKENIDNIIHTWDISKNIDINPISYILKNKVGSYIWGKLYSLDIIRDKGISFDTNIAVGEDLQFNIKYIQFVKNILFCDSIYYYRISMSSSSNNFKPRLVTERLKAAKFMHNIISKVNISNTEKDLIYVKYGVIGSLRYVMKNKKYSYINNIIDNIDLEIAKFRYAKFIGLKWVVFYIIILFFTKFIKR